MAGSADFHSAATPSALLTRTALRTATTSATAAVATLRASAAAISARAAASSASRSVAICAWAAVAVDFLLSLVSGCAHVGCLLGANGLDSKTRREVEICEALHQVVLQGAVGLV